MSLEKKAIAGKVRRSGRIVAAALLTVGALGVAAQPAAAATGYNIMLVGKSIPAGVGSVVLVPEGQHDGVCVQKLQSGVDKNTGVNIQPGKGLLAQVGRDSACQGERGQVLLGIAPTDNHGLTNWWISLSNGV